MHIPSRAFPGWSGIGVRVHSTSTRPGPRTLEGLTFEPPTQPGVLWPVQVYHGTQVQFEHAFHCGLESPQTNVVDTTDPELMKAVLEQHLAGPHDDHATALRQGQPFFGSQFVATSRHRGIGEEFALWHPKDHQGWLYFIDLKRLAVHHEAWISDAQGQSGYQREGEFSVLHLVPPDCLVGALAVRRAGLTGVQAEPDASFVPNPAYVPEPVPPKDEL